MDTTKRNLTNTEKIALSSMLAQEEAATRRFTAIRSAFEADLRNRLGFGADGFLEIDVAAGTVTLNVLRPDEISQAN